MERVTLEAKEAAAYIGVSYWTILDMAKQKRIPHVRVGRRVLFRTVALDSWMDEQEKQSVAQINEFGKIRRLS